MDDTQIISLYLKRDESAIQHTAEKYGSYLGCVAYNILRCHEDTEEVVEDTYLSAWNAIPPHIPQKLKHYLSRIARNLAFNRLDYLTAKRRDPHMLVVLSELDACIPDNGTDLEKHMDSKLLGQCLNQFLSTLEKKDCVLFMYRYYHCLTIKEIAEKCGMTERNVKYRMSCLRQQLRKELKKEGIYV